MVPRNRITNRGSGTHPRVAVPGMNDPGVVLVASGLSDHSHLPVSYAARLADRLGRALVITHAVEIPVPVGPNLISGPSLEQMLRSARERTAAQADAVLVARPRLDVRTAVAVGSPIEVVLAASADAFVTVMGAGRHRVDPPHRLLDRIACPVIVVPDAATTGEGPTVVGVAVEGPREYTTDVATALIGARPRYLVTLRPGAQHVVNLESGALPVDRLVIRVVAPARALPQSLARVAMEYRAGLVVVDHHRSRWPFHPGATGGSVASRFDCPVVFVPAPDIPLTVTAASRVVRPESVLAAT